MKVNLVTDIDGLMARACPNPALEMRMLKSFSHLEYLAAEHIRNNITKNTPDEDLEDIHQHAKEEDDHGNTLWSLSQHFSTDNPIYDEIEERFNEITTSFLNGYFGNELLLSLKDRHASYIHGALTIEKLPFLIYSSYLKHTNYTNAHKSIPQVVEDERDHLQLGGRLRKKLDQKKWLSLTVLDKIQTEISQLKIQRMSRFLDEKLNGEGEITFEKQLSQNDMQLTAWLQAIDILVRNEFPHCYEELNLQKIRKCLILKNRGYSPFPRYQELINNFLKALTNYSKHGFEPNTYKQRLQIHLEALKSETFNINLAYTLEKNIRPANGFFEFTDERETKYFNNLRSQSFEVIQKNSDQYHIKKKWA